MRDAWRKFAHQRAPRYTSYPTAAAFTADVSAADFEDRLAAIDLYETLSIYVHVPFCKRLCWYCGCNMRVENKYDRAGSYLRALIDEIQIVGGRLGGRGRPVAVHFGGGSPNFLSVDDIAKLLHAIELEIGLTDDARLAIELDPRLIRDGDIDRLAAIGFKRMSLGVQDFDPGVQQAINRIQSFEMVEAAICAMRSANIDDVSVDLIYGLPRQTRATFSDTLSKTIALSPDRVSVFGYAHLPAALPRQRLISDSDLPDADTRLELAMLADRELTDGGYIRIGFDHYAKPDNRLAAAARTGALVRNFQGFTDDKARSTLGFGASAVGFVHDLYYQNEKSLPDYERSLRTRRLPVARGAAQSYADKIVANVITDLLCSGEADISGVFGLLNRADQTSLKKRLYDFQDAGVLENRRGIVTMSPGAFWLRRAVAAAVDPRITNTTMAYSAAV